MTRHDLFAGNESHKFSSAHMSTFPDGTKERMHGHNFFVTVSLQLATAAPDKMVDFGLVKRQLAEQCAAWDQRLLLAAKSPLMRDLRHDDRECEFTLCGERYVLPAKDVLLLPMHNVICEALAETFAGTLLTRLASRFPENEVARLSVTITESPGQGATFHAVLPAP